MHSLIDGARQFRSRVMPAMETRFQELATGQSPHTEYAVSALRVQHIVVCAHSGCGAIGGLLAPESLGELPEVAAWVEHAAPTREAVASVPADERPDHAIRHNALMQLENLAAHSAVGQALSAGTLTLHAWVYDIGTGEVEVLDADGGSK